jgi:glycine/D-amino acid oxidase-like deaminating enzyme/nitrite reductase/ring-hydroxylating ferredoxin subunit
MKEPMMQSANGQTVSIWMSDTDLPVYPPLAAPLRTGVAVVGAGIAGLTTAYLLAKQGFEVAVIDDGPIGGGDTGRTTAQVTSILDKGYSETEELRGEDGARLAAASHMAAIAQIEQIVQEHSISCDFQRLDGYLFLGEDDTRQTLLDELEAASKAGLDVELVGDGIAVEGGSLGPALRFRNQAHFHPLNYLAGLARAAANLGVQIFCGTHIEKVNGGSIPTLQTDDGLLITADSVVLATHAPINDALGYSSRMFPFMTYVVGLSLSKGSLPAFLAFDTEDPYHYIRIHPEATHDVLIVGGEDHKTGQADDQDVRYARLEQWTREQFPLAGELLYQWSGQVMNTLDGLAMAGPDLVSENVFVITGQSGIGMTHSTIGAMIVSDQIAGRSNPWAELYAPDRVPVRGLGEVVSEGLNVLSRYAELLKGGEVGSELDIPPGSGAVMGWGPGKVAVYRDEQGVVHRRSAICSHLGCVVGWNDSEKTWDCPCHGSRFDAYGKVVNGPAPSDLDEVRP